MTKLKQYSLSGSSDFQTWNSGDWHNSSVIWDDVGQKWRPYKSGAGTGEGTPGGSDTQVQFNDSSSFGGDNAFTWDKNSNTLNIIGSISSQKISGQWTTPLAIGRESLPASESLIGQIWRTSGATGEKTYVWICLLNSLGSPSWVKLAESA